MSCLEARELLPELALGVLPAAERDEVERHLRWCAGCRKEASELGSAAATLAFALEPAPLPAGLVDRVVGRIRRTAASPETSRRARATAAWMIAAMVGVASLGWGAAMAGRADRYEERAERVERERLADLRRFETVLAGIIPGQPLPEEQTHLGELRPEPEGQGGGSALQLLSPTKFDFSLVIVGGLPRDPSRLPYRVQLVNAAGQVLKAGRIDELDADGGADAFHEFANADLTGFMIVRVVDASGSVVLSGEVDQG
jgi:hypothetical protein